MNDYLANLAARSLNSAPALQPRLRSRFEPATRNGALDLGQPLAAMPDETALEAMTAENESGPSPVATRRNPGRHASESISATPREIPPASQPTENAGANPNAVSIIGMLAQPHLTIRPPEPARPFQPATPAATDRRIALDRPLSETVESKKTEASAQPSPRRNDEESSRSIEGRQTQPVIREQIVVKDGLRQREPERRPIHPTTVETESSPGGQEHPRGHLAAIQPLVTQPPIAPLFEDQSADSLGRGDDRGAPPAPTIHVTIGRIEVRAVQATSPSSPKPRPAQPAMSLDDYLQRRGNGGGR